MQRIYYFFDTDSRELLNQQYAPVRGSGALKLIARDKVIMCLSAVRRVGAEWTAVEFATGTTFRMGLKVDGSLSAATYLAFSDIDQVNIAGDWADASLATGKISVRLDLNTVAIATLFASDDETENCWLELEALDGDDNATTMFQAETSLLPDVVRNTAEPEEGQPEYVTMAQVEALLATIISVPEGYRFKVNADLTTSLEVLAE